MLKTIRQCLVVTAFLTLLCCVAYPGIVTGLAQLLFSREANGSVVEQNGEVKGSALIGQAFSEPTRWPEYFWGRPSAASVDAATGVTYSSGSNYGPMNAALIDEVKARVDALRASGVTGPIPIDLVTKSGSGLDAHVSPAAADVQVPRVAKARNLPENELRAMIARSTEGSTFGLLGEPRVNVLLLNLALDARAPVPHAASPSPPSSGAAASW